MRSLISTNSSLKICCTNLSGTGSRPSPKYDPASNPTEDDSVIWVTVDPNGAEKIDVDANGNDRELLAENTGTQDIAFETGDSPGHSAHHLNDNMKEEHNSQAYTESSTDTLT